MSEAMQPVYPQALILKATPPEGARLLADQRVTMRDGVRLCVDVYLPQTPGRYPALLSLSPYSKDIQQKPPQWSHAIESGATGFYVGHGYVHVIAQARGNGLSEGRWALFSEAERSDGYDLVEWIAAQDWCDGNVGTIGDSYWSWTQYHTAAQQPPHLRCICQCDATTDLYRDLAYQGGVYNAEFMDTWISYQTKMAAWPGEVPGKQEPMNLTWEAAMHPTDGPWWRERSAWTYLDRIKAPVLSYTTEALAAPLRLWGPVALTLHASSSQPDTVWHAKLFDVPPQGAPRQLSRGILRASFRAVDAARSAPGQPFHPFERQELLTPREVYEFQIEMRPMFHTLAAGHRLMLTLASEDIAYSNRQRTIDVPLLPWPVTNTVLHDVAHPSHLLLPVIPDAPEIAPVTAPVRDIDWPAPAASWVADTEGWPLR